MVLEIVAVPADPAGNPLLNAEAKHLKDSLNVCHYKSFIHILVSTFQKCCGDKLAHYP